MIVVKEVKKDRIVYHRHEDLIGNVFGSEHLASAIHQNPKTVKAHNISIKREKLDDKVFLKKYGLKESLIQEIQK